MHIEATQFLSNADEKLKTIINLLPEPSYESTQDVFFDLVSCIIEQQIHYRSSKKIFEKRLKIAGLESLTVESFPIFEEKGLKDLKISLRKQETLLALVEFFSQNHLNWQEMSEKEVRQILSAIKGIGRWTIDMILLFTLKHQDIFPYDDFQLKQIMVSHYGLNPNNKLKAQMLAIAENWGNYKSLAVRYLWALKK